MDELATKLSAPSHAPVSDHADAGSENAAPDSALIYLLVLLALVLRHNFSLEQMPPGAIMISLHELVVQ